MIRVRRELVDRLRREAARAYPEECCGALLGREGSGSGREGAGRELGDAPPPGNAPPAGDEVSAGDEASAGDGASAGDESRTVDRLRPVPNARRTDRNRRYLIDPATLLDVEKEARTEGLEVLGFYHSHPDHPAEPSQFDREHAWPWYSYVIVPVRRGIPGAPRSWRLAEDRSRFRAERIAEAAGPHAHTRGA